MSDTFTPVIPNLPELQRTLVTRAEQLAPFLQNLAQPLPASYIQLQQQRINRGQSPWSLNESVRALQSARTGQAVTRSPERSPFSPGALLSNLRHDLGAVLSSLPRLPSAIVDEVRSLPELPASLTAASNELARGNIGQAIYSLTSAPGIRFLPGAFTVGNVATGNFSELARHPLMTALDLAPVATSLARATPAARLATATRLNEGSFAAPHPVRAALTRQVGDLGGGSVLVPNRLGQVTGRLADTRLGRLGQEAFGADTRRMMHAKAFHEQGVSEAFDTRIDLDPADPNYALNLAARRSSETYLEYKDAFTPERMVELTRGVQTDPIGIRVGATPQELSFINRIAEHAEDMRRLKLDDDLMVEFRGESYDKTTGARLYAAQSKFERRAARLFTEGGVVDRLADLSAKSGDARVATIHQALLDGDFLTANRELSNIGRRRTAVQSPSQVGKKPGADTNVTLAALRNMRTDVQKAWKAKRELEYMHRTTPPARFIPKLQDDVAAATEAFYNNKYRNLAEKGRITFAESDEMAVRLTEALSKRFVDDVPLFNTTEFRRIQRDVAKTWVELRNQGFDPIFVHHAPRSKMVQEINFPRIRVSEVTPSSVKERMLDFSPTVDDATIAMSHEVAELILQRATTQFIDDVQGMFGKSIDDVRAEMRPIAERRFDADSTTSFATYLDEAIKSKYTVYDRENMIRTFSGKPTTGMEATRAAERLATGADPVVYIPRTLSNNLDRLKPYNTKGMAAIFDPVLNVFRTSVLPLSPRWHINNIVGGAIMLAGQTNPVSVWRHLGEAVSMIRGNRAGVPTELRRVLGTANRDVIELNYLSGRTARRLWDRIQESKLAENTNTAGAIGKVRGAGQSIIAKSFEVNAFFDDAYRAMAFLYGKDKSIRKGMTAAQAERAGMELARRTLQAWDEITPIERSILRSIFPFYGFTQHILRYTMKYPFDHPMRSAVLAAVARAELEDLGTGLPQSFLELIPFGKPDALGNQQALNTHGFNPFSDVADLFTLGGFIGGANPVISTTLQQLGIDPISGSAELYPDLRYDPSTGRLSANTKNPLLALATNTIPQSRALMEFIAPTNDFRALLSTNPDAARRLLQSQIGFSTPVRPTNTIQELMKQEVRRYQDQEQAFRDALRSGDDTYANEYTGLRARLQQLRQLQSQGVLDALTLSSDNVPSMPRLLSPVPLPAP